MARKAEVPIFYDRKGRRWKIVKATSVVLLGVAMWAGVYTVPRVLHNTKVTGYEMSSAVAAAPVDPVATDSPAEIADQINNSNAPVFGAGPLARVVRIQQTTNGYEAVPVYGNGEAELLSTSQSLTVGDHKYAIERYGQTSNKRIALTFDDGPDPTWTPKILDELSAYHARATFFEIGREIVKYPAITQRIVQEGHIVGNHTFDHVNFDTVGAFRADLEINQTQRVIRAVTGHATSFVRLPYAGSDEQSLRNFVRGILEAQRLGYVVTYFQFDSNDWTFNAGGKPTLPNFDGSDLVVLLHDGGGDRSRTLPYLASLIKDARAHGYTFVTLNGLYPQSPSLFSPQAPSLADKVALESASAYLVWPHAIINKLFVLTLISVLVSTIINVLLASIQIHRVKYKRRKNNYFPLVSIIVPAYNEEAVLTKTISSLLRSRYKNIEVIIVDDGSKDKTSRVARQLAEQQPKVLAFRKKNGGKARAMNYGIKKANGEIIVGIDADTVFSPATVGKLVRHFSNPEVGAVAGAVKVGNIRNLLTRWQMLDYTIGIYIERNAQALLSAVMIVPGACGAWRKEAVLAAHGYSSSTLAEDFDLTLALHRAGYKVLQDNGAIAYTEAPLGVRGLFKQRFRWIFGDIQAFWKYRQLIFRRRFGWLGLYALPAAIYSIIMPMVFGPLLLLVELENLLSGNYEIILLFLVITMGMQFVIATVGLLLAREKLSYLIAVPLTRVLYSPLRSFILYRSLLHALKGAHVGWNKLQRTGTVHYRSKSQLNAARALARKALEPGG